MTMCPFVFFRFLNRCLTDKLCYTVRYFINHCQIIFIFHLKPVILLLFTFCDVFRWTSNWSTRWIAQWTLTAVIRKACGKKQTSTQLVYFNQINNIRSFWMAAVEVVFPEVRLIWYYHFVAYCARFQITQGINYKLVLHFCNPCWEI